MNKLLFYIMGLILLVPITFADLNITIWSPINNSNYTTSSVNLEWGTNGTIDWAAYNLDNGGNNSKSATPMK